MPSIKVRDPFKRLAMRGAIFFTEVSSLLAALLALSTVNPAYAWEGHAENLDQQVEDLVRAIDNGGLDIESRNPLNLWMSADVSQRVTNLWSSIPASTRAKGSSAVKRAIAAKIQKQLGARQSAAWAAWSAWSHW